MTKAKQRRRKMTLLPHSKSWILHEFYSQRNWSRPRRMEAKERRLANRPQQNTTRRGLRIPMIYWQRSLWRMRGMSFEACSSAVYFLTSSRFPAAVTDFKACLAIHQSMFPEEHEAVAEAHYKLSLALEFASITRTKEEGEEPNEAEDDATFDQAMRDEAVKEMEAAITSVKIKLQNKEVELASSFSPDDNEITIAQITDAREIIAEMEQRVSSAFILHCVFQSTRLISYL
jgi:hypothetical protein